MGENKKNTHVKLRSEQNLFFFYTRTREIVIIKNEKQIMWPDATYFKSHYGSIQLSRGINFLEFSCA